MNRSQHIIKTNTVCS